MLGIVGDGTKALICIAVLVVAFLMLNYEDRMLISTAKFLLGLCAIGIAIVVLL